ncbi:hypothetical protein A6X20_30680 [Bradyrhizobium elkanii]|nr:hypothetical protein A6452_09020 [Bradyrhizobium elkanii]ODM76172.1 hypothetical protein A6X20_30680 [Bradyrhizobium elkanii]
MRPKLFELAVDDLALFFCRYLPGAPAGFDPVHNVFRKVDVVHVTLLPKRRADARLSEDDGVYLPADDEDRCRDGIGRRE